MIPYGKHYIDEEDIQAVTAVLKSNYLTQGPMSQEFEETVAAYTGATFAVAVSNGTAALHLATLAADIGVGDSIVTSPITFVASANAGLYVGAKVLFADIDPQTVNMSAEALQNQLQKHNNVKAIIPVHFAGLPCDMESIKSLADDNNAVVIEDAAHALGGTYADGRKIGCCSNSLMTVFSFHPVKAIACGEGGMITTNDEAIYHRLLRLRGHGINKSTDSFLYTEQTDENGLFASWYYEMQELGYNYRITDIQCALGLSQFSKIELFVNRRKTLVGRYDQAFLNLDNCIPAQMSGRENSGHHVYVLRIDFDKAGLSRQQFMLSLKERGIGSQVHYIPVPMQPYYQQLGHEIKDYPNAISYYKQAITIPLYYSLKDEEQEKVIDAIKEILG